MKITKSIAILLITEMICISAAVPFGTAASFAASGAPGATELALDLYGNNSSKKEKTENSKKEKTDSSKEEKAAGGDKSSRNTKNGKGVKNKEKAESGKGKKSAGKAKSDNDGAKAKSKSGGKPAANDKKDKKTKNKSDAKSTEISEISIKADSGHFAEGLAQKYDPAGGSCTITAESRFYIETETDPSDELLRTVKLIDSEFAAYGIPSKDVLQIVYGKAEKAEPGDIVIRMVPDEEFEPGITTADKNEAYVLSLGEMTELSACGEDGVYYGLLTLLEMLREKQSGEKKSSKGENKTDGSVKLDGAVITDGPELAERAVLLDCGRRYFGKDWIENFIKRASMQRYNAIVMHFSEAEGLRLDSRAFPWLTDDIASLSMDEMAEIIRTAEDYHMEVIPSFDMPGHNMYLVKRYAKYVATHPEFSFEFDGKTYDSSIKGFGSIANHWSNNGKTRNADYIGIDVTREHAAAFVGALTDDYASFFAEMGCTKFDMGGDELLGWYSFDLGGEHFSFANRWKALDHWAKYAKEELGISKGSSSDTYVSFLNGMAERLEAMGFTCRVFNDDIDINSDQHVSLNESIEVTYWFPVTNSAQHFAKSGHNVRNFVENWCFYVLRSNNGKDIMDNKYRSVNARNIYDNWDPRKFTGSVNDGKKVPRSRLSGGYFAIWCDHPDFKSDREIWEETELKMWANASKMWNPEVSTGKSGIQAELAYDDMKKFVKKMNGFPGYTGKTGEEASLPEPAEPEAVKSWWQELIAF